MCGNPSDPQNERVYYGDGAWHSLSGNESGGQSRDGILTAGFKAGQSKDGGLGYAEEQSPTLSAMPSALEPTVLTKAYSFDALSSNSMKSSNPNSGCRQTETAKTLDCFDPNPSKNQGGIAVVASGFDGQMGPKAHGIAYEKEKAPTLKSGGVERTFYAVDCRNGKENADVNGTLQAKDGGGTSLNCNNIVRVDSRESGE